MTMQEFYGVFMPVVEYYKADLSKAVIALYFEDLGGYGASELKAALKELRQTRKFSNMPTIAEILELLEGDFDTKAQLALDELSGAIRRYGAYRSVCFDDAAIMSVVRAAGGWVKICNMSEKEWADFKKWDFVKLYKIYARKTDEAPKYLIGISEQQNAFDAQTAKFDKVHFIGKQPREPMLAVEFRARLEKEMPVLSAISETIKRIGA